MCDKTETTVAVENTPMNTMYVPNGRTDLEQCIKALRDKADKMEALLKSIPESITPEAHQGLQYIASLFWRSY